MRKPIKKKMGHMGHPIKSGDDGIGREILTQSKHASCYNQMIKKRLWTMRALKVILVGFVASLVGLAIAYVLKPEIVESAFREKFFSPPMFLTILVCVFSLLYGGLKKLRLITPQNQSPNSDTSESE